MRFILLPILKINVPSKTSYYFLNSYLFSFIDFFSHSLSFSHFSLSFSLFFWFLFINQPKLVKYLVNHFNILKDHSVCCLFSRRIILQKLSEYVVRISLHFGLILPICLGDWSCYFENIVGFMKQRFTHISCLL